MKKQAQQLGLSVLLAIFAVTSTAQSRVLAKNTPTPRELIEVAQITTSTPGDTKPPGCPSQWCGCWLSMEIFGENRPDLWAARNWLKFPRVTPQPGAIVVLKRGTSPNAGHVGIVVSIDANGNPVVKSGNHRQRVAVSTYPRNQVIAYVKI